MQNTYKAILTGDRLEWSGDAPEISRENSPVAVHVTILDDDIHVTDVLTQGERMAAALERLAAIPAGEEITDPVAWEREIREDRVLPGRDT
jgi:hypothetical protein